MEVMKIEIIVVRHSFFFVIHSFENFAFSIDLGTTCNAGQIRCMNFTGGLECISKLSLCNGVK